MNFPNELNYLYGEPANRAVIRTEADDFRVTEDLSFEPEGSGDHVFLYIRKTGENTDWVARQLAHFCQVSPKEVGYAGKKDRHAVTEQWFSVHLPGRAPLTWSLFETETIKVLKAVKHTRKLRLGSLNGNRFEIRLRQVSEPAELLRRAEQIRAGVPNYFGEQRFGHHQGNLHKGALLIAGKLKERQRHKKGLYISAVRSYMFNQLVSQRIAQSLFSQPMPGDVLMINGSQSCFPFDPQDDTILSRLQSADLHLTAAMWGRGRSICTAEAAAWEIAQLTPWQEQLEGLERLGLNQERRSTRLMPANLTIEQEADDQFVLAFNLPAGSFATSVLRELAQVSSASGQPEPESE
ncbi:tRNA pseudouridine13 synthase [Amphritea atlantica]|jgi:tRNA pseudouridine13 synthase|uniref:tRNA pseudouridine synthase D n=1 Tax=Amphritea atlantica TaxID=355243 RepID=A0A1H9K9G4_9GAMM|nr:tRNA pseudouridine(13) synthase TruD [Amphritea atlantica]SEQ95764.1 tRNA pseudouridine13 synthase [Amphritea atlantica]